MGLISEDGRWRVEQSRSGYTVRWHPDPASRRSVVRLNRATMDQVVRFLEAEGVDPDTLRPA